jgi:hypothetical protein
MNVHASYVSVDDFDGLVFQVSFGGRNAVIPAFLEKQEPPGQSHATVTGTFGTIVRETASED